MMFKASKNAILVAILICMKLYGLNGAAIQEVDYVQIGTCNDPLKEYRNMTDMKEQELAAILEAEKVPQNIVRSSTLFAAGSFSKVYEATDMENGQKLAVKNMSLGDKWAYLQACKEVILTKKIPHPNLVKFHSFSIEEENGEKRIGVAMEKLKYSLDDLRKAKLLGDRKVIAYIARELLKGIAWLHKNEVLYHDLKPNNYLISENGELKLIDFGIASILTSHGQKVENIGAPGFSSPAHYVGYDGDIFCVGSNILYLATCQDMADGFAMRHRLKRLQDTNSTELFDFIEKCSQDNSAAELLEHQFLKQAMTQQEFAALIAANLGK